MTLVVDNSAIVNALAATPRPAGLLATLSEDGDFHAPHLIDVEFLQATRGLVRSKQLTLDRAADAHLDFASLPLTRYPHAPLSDRVWELRDNLSAYDAMYVALAEALEAPLVTCDAKLAAGARKTGAEVLLFAPEG